MSNAKMDILVCTDFSESSSLAVSHAAKLALRLDARLHLCHIVEGERLVVETNLGMNIPDEFPEAQQARKMLQHQLAALGADIDAQVHVRIGTPTAGILSLVSELRPDFMVICSHGNSRLRRLLGSVSRQLTLRCPVPVLIIPTPGRELLLNQPAPPQDPELPAFGHSVGSDNSHSGATGVGISGVGGAEITYR